MEVIIWMLGIFLALVLFAFGVLIALRIAKPQTAAAARLQQGMNTSVANPAPTPPAPSQNAQFPWKTVWACALGGGIAIVALLLLYFLLAPLFSGSEVSRISFNDVDGFARTYGVYIFGVLAILMVVGALVRGKKWDERAKLLTWPALIIVLFLFGGARIMGWYVGLGTHSSRNSTIATLEISFAPGDTTQTGQIPPHEYVHLCGHDAMLLSDSQGKAYTVVNQREDLPNQVKLLFVPGGQEPPSCY